MPIYEYRCDKCKKVHEVLQKISDAPLRKCPACSGRLEKLISRTSFQLKGSGWYVTDYARKGKGSGETSESGEKSESSDKSESGEKAGGGSSTSSSESPAAASSASSSGTDAAPRKSGGRAKKSS